MAMAASRPTKRSAFDKKVQAQATIMRDSAFLAQQLSTSSDTSTSSQATDTNGDGSVSLDEFSQRSCGQGRELRQAAATVQPHRQQRRWLDQPGRKFRLSRQPVQASAVSRQTSQAVHRRAADGGSAVVAAATSAAARSQYGSGIARQCQRSAVAGAERLSARRASRPTWSASCKACSRRQRSSNGSRRLRAASTPPPFARHARPHLQEAAMPRSPRSPCRCCSPLAAPAFAAAPHYLDDRSTAGVGDHFVLQRDQPAGICAGLVVLRGRPGRADVRRLRHGYQNTASVTVTSGERPATAPRAAPTGTLPVSLDAVDTQASTAISPAATRCGWPTRDPGRAAVPAAAHRRGPSQARPRAPARATCPTSCDPVNEQQLGGEDQRDHHHQRPDQLGAEADAGAGRRDSRRPPARPPSRRRPARRTSPDGMNSVSAPRLEARLRILVLPAARVTPRPNSATKPMVRNEPVPGPKMPS